MKGSSNSKTGASPSNAEERETFFGLLSNTKQKWYQFVGKEEFSFTMHSLS